MMTRDQGPGVLGMRPALLAARVAVTAAAGWTAAGSLYLAGLALSAARERRRLVRPPAAGGPARLLVLIPAHDEEALIGRTLASLHGAVPLGWPVRVVVVADNCADGTAAEARRGGAEVLERDEPERRGKGAALACALSRLESDLPACEAVVFLDADCDVSPNLLIALHARIADGASAAQVSYEVGNPEESWSTALRWAAFALMHVARPLGRQSIGLSAGIFGTGFALTPALLRRCPWQAFGLAEDGEYHLRLVAAGERVVFVPEARVVSAMPRSLRAAEAQQMRWEAGRWQLVRRWTMLLLATGVRERDLRRVLSGLEPLIPAQSLMATLNLTCLLLGRLPGLRGTRLLGIVGGGAQAVYVLAGLMMARAPREVWRAMVFAPALVSWKLLLAARLLAGRGPTGWVPTRAGAGRSGAAS